MKPSIRLIVLLIVGMFLCARTGVFGNDQTKSFTENVEASYEEMQPGLHITPEVALAIIVVIGIAASFLFMGRLKDEDEDDLWTAQRRKRVQPMRKSHMAMK